MIELRLTRRLLAQSVMASLMLTTSFSVHAGHYPVTVLDSVDEHTFFKKPQRVVALQWDLLENLVGLGIKPIGAADIGPWSAWVREPHLPDGIVDVGTRAEPNLERIAALEPDLVLIGPTQLNLKKSLERFSKVLVFENYRANAKSGQAQEAINQYLTLARIFNLEQKANQDIASWQMALKEMGQSIRNHFGFVPSVQVIRFSGLTTLFVYTPNSIADFVLRQMGITQPYVRDNANYGLTQVRIRDLKDLNDAYVVYVLPFAQEKKVLQSILWQAMPFARRKHVAAAKAYWSHGGAPSILVTAQSIYEALMSIRVEGK